MEVNRREGSCGEVFFWGIHGGDGPECAFAVVDDGVSGDGDSVFEGEKFAVTHGWLRC
jgi:hypothetical protein